MDYENFYFRISTNISIKFEVAKKWIICRNIVGSVNKTFTFSTCGKGKLVFVWELVPIKVVPTMIISFIKNSNSIDSKWMGFCIGADFNRLKLGQNLYNIWRFKCCQLYRFAVLGTSRRRYISLRQNWNICLIVVIFWICLRFRNIEIKYLGKMDIWIPKDSA